MSETRERYDAGQDDPRHWLVSLIRDGRAVAGPIYIGAVDRLAAARIAYDELPGVKDSDILRVWTLLEFEYNDPPGEYAAGNVRFNQPIAKQRPGLDLCPKCGNDAAGLDLYTDRSGDDTIVCRKCGAQLRGLDYPELLDYLYGRRNRQAD